MQLGANQIFRFSNAFVLVAFGFIAILVHHSQVRVPDKTEARCTARDTPVGCWDHGGGYRAASFVAPTTGISFADIGVGVIYNPDGSTRPVTATPFDVLFDAADKTTSRLQTACVADFPDTDLVTVGDQFPEEHFACLAERVPALWEIPNGALAGDQWTLAGGIHVWYFMWISLWISASFAVTMVPDYYGAKYVKFPIIAFWHFIGVVLTVMIYVDDPFFQMRLPLNNVIIGCALQALAALAQFYWEVEAMYDGHGVAPAKVAGNETSADGTQTEGMGSRYAGRGAPLSLTALMTLGIDGDSRRGSTHTAKSHSHAGSVTAAEDRVALVTHQRDIFAWKATHKELFEALNVELALTMPALLLAVFGMVSRVNIDWVVSSLFLRSTLFFLGLAACFKALKFHAEAKQHGLGGVLRVTVAVFAAVMIYLVAWVLFDWYHPMAQTTSHWGDAFPGGLRTTAMITLVVTVILVSLFLVGLLVVGVVFPAILEEDVKGSTEESAYMALQALLLVVRVFLFVCTVSPGTWYGAFDKMAVPLNYP
jgi:hypothetical protein